MAGETHFLRHLAYPAIHDAVVVSLQVDGATARVTLQSYEGAVFTIEFDGVESVAKHRPEGMRLYSVAEKTAPAALRSFVFTNWDEEDDAALEVLAHDFRIIAGS